MHKSGSTFPAKVEINQTAGGEGYTGTFQPVSCTVKQMLVPRHWVPVSCTSATLVGKCSIAVTYHSALLAEA